MADERDLVTGEPVTVGGVALEERRLGHGSPLVYLHGEDGLLFSSPLLGSLAERFEVRAPVHPGWGRSERPKHLRTVEDLSYLYLDYLEATLERPAPMVAASFGAWLAASTATKSTSLISALVLICPVGIKVSDHQTRDFVDTYAIGHQEVDRAYYGDGPRPDLTALAPGDFEDLAQAQEAMARFGFKPYLHDPGLVHRLHRIDVPTLVLWGADDLFVQDPAAYAKAYGEAIGDNARTRELPGGHRLEEQAPAAVAEAVADFLGASAPATTGAAR
ncbi:MAG TPA: alpha/beta fold hydrolase [Acidimicrobiales bacterium]|jgi:pimeloyl-ACP methyl ester carboxylesterase|nr:alpha/beta fold hydrolase [Acidimicrobiales bacterium]